MNSHLDTVSQHLPQPAERTYPQNHPKRVNDQDRAGLSVSLVGKELVCCFGDWGTIGRFWVQNNGKRKAGRSLLGSLYCKFDVDIKIALSYKTLKIKAFYNNCSFVQSISVNSWSGGGALSPDGFERILETPGGEILVQISRTTEGTSWIGTISCRDCHTKPFKDMVYVVEEELKVLKDLISNLLKNIFYYRPDNGNIF